PPSSSPVAASAPLPDGRNFGYIKSLNASYRTLVFDLAYFYTGEAANQAAREDHKIGPHDTVDNDYYIRNNNPKLVTMHIADPVTLRVVDWQHCCDLVAGDYNRLAAAFEPGAHASSYHGPDSPYWL